MQEITFKIEEDLEDSGFIAEAYVAENEHIITQGSSVEELKIMIKEALECHFDNPLKSIANNGINFVVI